MSTFSTNAMAMTVAKVEVTDVEVTETSHKNQHSEHQSDPETRQVMRDQMEEFFFGAEARVPEGWTPPGAGGSSKGGAAPRKK